LGRFLFVCQLDFGISAWLPECSPAAQWDHGFPFPMEGLQTMSLSKPEMVAVLDHLYGQIFEEYFSGSAYRNKITGNLLMVLLLKIKECLPDGLHAVERDRQSQIVRTFKRTLESHYRDLLNGTGQKVFRPQDYATAQNLHPNYLNSVVKSRTGRSVSAWITEKTISEAKSLLQNSSVSIKEIAYQLGFAEPCHFSNYFKKHTALSPMCYRRQAGT
jgi:AraC-like DNA-binding protein